MAITIGIAIDDLTIEQEEYVLLDDELIEYMYQLDHLEKFPAFKQLGQFDPYGVTLIPLSMQKELKRELPEVIELAENKSLPNPPDYVGLEGGSVDADFGEKFGWQGLICFLRNLEKIISNNKPLLAIGD